MQGKVIVVTGAFGALGQVVAEAASARGAQVVLVDAAPGAREPITWPHALQLAGVDLTDADATMRAAAAVMEKCGRVDGLVNIAGGFRWEKIAEGDVDTWDRLYTMNVKTCLNACRALLPHMAAAGGGRIVNVGAAGAAKAAAGMGAYAASKSGVLRLTEALAEEQKDAGITVNAVLPSIIDTAVNRADMPTADFSRWVTPAALADVILFLLSDASRAITGAGIPVVGRV